jgi:cobalamin-dependent methionine synthase I
VIQQAVPMPLFASAQILSQPEAIKSHQGTLTVNSITADPATLADSLQQALQYEADVVVLLVRPGLVPVTAEDRLQIALDVLETAVQVGFSLSRLYLDPLFQPKPAPVTWQLSRGIPDIDPVLETLTLLPHLSSEKVRTLVALSEASRYLNADRRTGLQHRLLPMLLDAGLDAVILNCRDSRLMEIARAPRSTAQSTVGAGNQALPFLLHDWTAADPAGLLW